MMNNSLAVKEFTEGSTGKECPKFPVALDKDQVLFVIRMVVSELDELAATVCDNETDKNLLMLEALNTRDKCTEYNYPSNVDLIAAQADSMVDAWYYMLNVAAKSGINLSKVFDIVHAANMAKRDPITNKFIRRESDGKVIKPNGWQPPNIEKEIKEHLEKGSW
jgi:predicted HAD superfamily Cof-like phosphohydrolase